MAAQDRVQSAIENLTSVVRQGDTSAYNATLITALNATATVCPGPARLAAIYAMSSVTGTISVQGFRDESASAVSLVIASAVSGPVVQFDPPAYLASIALNSNTTGDNRKILVVWKSAS